VTDPNGGLLLGSHMSIAGGVDKAPARGASVGCTAMQVFVKNNNRWQGPPIAPQAAARWRAELDRAGIAPSAVFAHTCYLINLASTREEVLAKSIDALEDELRRCELLGIPGLVMHPGAHLGAGREAGIAQIARHCRTIFDRIPDGRCRVLFEGTVGSGTNLGGTFEDLRDLLAAVDRPDRVGVCLDTCHLFAAGYDLRTPEAFAETIAAFDRIVGLGHVRALHLNDSKHGLGSRKDRHEHIGKGMIGTEAFRLVLNHPALRAVPMSLETEKGEDLAEDRVNLGVLRSLIAPAG
jgi:deoxyribonuclease-4